MDDRSVESIDAKEEEDVQEEELHDNLTDEKGERSLMDRAVDSLNQLCASFEDICKSRLDQFQTRLAASQARLPHIQCYLKQQQDTMASLELQLRESVAKYKSWQQKWSQEKEDRRMQKEWMADIWPSFVVVPPTILKPFMKDLSAGEKQKRSEASWMKMRLDEEGLRVQERIAHVDNYYYNATTGESSWKMPPVMAYAPPQGWDIVKNQWKDGVVVTLPGDFQSSPLNNVVTDTVFRKRARRSMSYSSSHRRKISRK